MTLLETMDWDEVVAHHHERVALSGRLHKLFSSEDVRRFSRLAVAASDDDYMANYSAYEHGLGSRILNASNDAHNRVFALAKRFMGTSDGLDIPAIIYQARIKYLAISVGSELSMMLKPSLFWVANTRSIWAHLLVKHGFSVRKANAELDLYRDDDDTSEMAYRKWKVIHSAMRPDLLSLMGMAATAAKAHAIDTESEKFLWIDSIANGLYSREHD